MKNRPTCCAPLKFNGAKGRIENLSPGFKARKCEAIARSTGKQCQDIAVTGTNRCRHHKGKQLFALNVLPKFHPKLKMVATNYGIKRRYDRALQHSGLV